MESIVIIGGGFAGMNLAKHLDTSRFRIHVIDRNNFHSFPPLFYQVASSGLDAASICFPLRREFKRRPGVYYHMGHVKNIDNLAEAASGAMGTSAVILEGSGCTPPRLNVFMILCCKR